MKKMITLLVLLSSINAFSEGLPKQCPEPAKSYIEHKEVKGKTFDIVHVFGETARDVYSELSGDETNTTENGKDLTIKSQGNIDCFRQYKTKNKAPCAVYECELGVLQK